jgi:methionyl-tRNA synthetase
MTNKNFYITTTIPYVNAEPHIGFALEIVQADALARAKRLENRHVFFNFGTDEHGLKIYRKALESSKKTQDYVDEYAAKFDDLKKILNLSYTHFIRTTSPHHQKAAQEFWRRCLANGDIYKKKYKAKYCVGCELEKTDSELANGRCPIHPTLKIETIEEENYFFRFSRYQKPLLKLYQKNPNLVKPQSKFNEIKKFVESGLRDFSISRLKKKLPWGVPVPNDPDHVMYVWFDALINYISTIGWPQKQSAFKKWWPGTQVAGKDNLRQQAAIWQAMLLSADLPTTKQIFIHGFISVDGQKLSKSLGNVVSPFELVKKYGTDPARYFLLAKIHPFEDSDFSYQKFEKAYQADLANGLGNLIARVAKLCQDSSLSFAKTSISFDQSIKKELELYRFDLALEKIWQKISTLDKYLETTKPWDKKKYELKTILTKAVYQIRQIAFNLKPFLPQTAHEIEKQFGGPKIKKGKALFPRLR